MRKAFKIVCVFLCFCLVFLVGCDKKEKVFVVEEGKPSVNVTVFGPMGEKLVDTKVGFLTGATAFDVTSFACNIQNQVVDFKGAGGTVYIAGIGSFYERDYGPDSGWLYSINGDYKLANKSCGAYVVKENDEISWVYTKNRGLDVGAPGFTNGQ